MRPRLLRTALRSLLRALLASLTLSATLAAGAEPGLGRIHTFKDWDIGCDNTRRCEAQGYGPEADEAGEAVPVRAALVVRRDAGPRQLPTLDFYFGGLDASDAFPRAGQVLTVQAGALRLRLPPLTQERNAPPVPAAQVPALLAAVLKAPEIVLSHGKRTWTVSLAGAHAALLKMDDLQGRVGTTGALVRRGPAAEPAAPPVPEVRAVRLPPTTDADRRLEPRIRAALPRSENDCPGFDATQSLAEPVRLTASTLLVLQPCWQGAYQTGSRVWQVDDRPPFRARALALPQPDGRQADSLVAELAEAAGGTLQLHESAKGRGIGDCWVSREWTFTAQGLALVSANESPCRLFEAGGLAIELWRSR